MPAEHYVRPEGLPEPSGQTRNWLSRLWGRINRFLFEKKPGYVPPYHGNFQGATINDPRYTPGLFNTPRTDDSGGESERDN